MSSAFCSLVDIFVFLRFFLGLGHNLRFDREFEDKRVVFIVGGVHIQVATQGCRKMAGVWKTESCAVAAYELGRDSPDLVERHEYLFPFVFGEMVSVAVDPYPDFAVVQTCQGEGYLALAVFDGIRHKVAYDLFYLVGIGIDIYLTVRYVQREL